MALFDVLRRDKSNSPPQIKSYDKMTEDEIKTALKQICDKICKKVTFFEEVSDAVKKKLKELGYSKEPEIGAVPHGVVVTIENPKGGFIHYEFETKKNLTPDEEPIE